MKIAILIRHGESDINVKGILSDSIDGNSLTERGIRQAEHARDQLTGLEIKNVYSSPINRARETAEIIASSFGKEVVIDDRLREIGLGKASGRRASDFRDELYTGHISGSIRKELEMEEWTSLQTRVVEALAAREGINVYTTHSDPIRAAISYFLELGEPESYGISIKNASMTFIDVEIGRILSIGSIIVSDEIKKYVSRRH
ncbi:phosphoglycerate mutase [Thermoplasma volcanium GSS1]|uniref:Phosphoglycerate mutase n=1 Tax=Thermoplasma volcanium (strain ATCC 51530 / DSM 4299 / JCM 9571 / NBRC 15438 / GSS1) TaxID=273116 RepID=Q97C47_THEVO|nr:2,3-diphosphoglycerate-dependent phosphoglycerate mutase [Thermoplasma volcanium]BAB59400.1 phosphoglycerate mutase [Thermoplasma volcanium GSS1]